MHINLNLSHHLAAVAAFIVFGLTTSSAYAEEWTDKLSISGFSSAVYQRSNSDILFNGDIHEAGIDKKGSFRETKIGFHLNANITDRITMGAQLLSSRSEENYVTHLDWGFMSIAVSNELTLRAGKIRFPVGLVNEYRAVGFAYPWISPPQIFYNDSFSGPNVTRESFTGISALWSREFDDWTLSVDGFAGDVALEVMNIRELAGLTVSANWNDNVTVQASLYDSTMYTSVATMSAMDEQEHKSAFIGARLNWNQFIAYAEIADVYMGNFKEGDAATGYITLGYKTGKLLPHITFQAFTEGDGTASVNEQNMSTLGLKIDAAKNTAVKLEISKVQTDKGAGLLESTPNKDIYILATSIDIVF